MKRSIMFLLLLIGALQAFSQAEKVENRYAAARFKTYHNNNKVDSIYTLFAPDMQAALPADKAREFLTALRSQAGAIKSMAFNKYDGPYASYITVFEKGTFVVNIALDNNHKVNGFFVQPHTDDSLPKPERNVTKLSLPFKEQWTVVWGGDTKELNYHVENTAQKNAFDMIITDQKGKSFVKDGKTNEDYYAFSKPLYAPCDAEVVLVTDGLKDNTPGVLNEHDVTGNTVVLKTANGEYLFFAHFKQHSIKVKKGQLVKSGELLGLCGNSGRSSEPHLHFHMQNTADQVAGTGIKTYFDEINVNGKILKDYSPIKSYKISPAK